MKQFIFSLAFGILVAFSARAQQADELKPFKMDVSIGYAAPGSGFTSGFLIAGEPKYAVLPNLALGVRVEVAALIRGRTYDAFGNKADASVKAAGSYLATGDFYFTDNYSFRPFIGAGVGAYTLASATSIDNETSTQKEGTKFGGMVRAGFEARHFRFGVEYNLVSSSTVQAYDATGNLYDIKSHNGYLGIKVGVCFGGGPR